jgi:hypothetical protein
MTNAGLQKFRVFQLQPVRPATAAAGEPALG